MVGEIIQIGGEVLKTFLGSIFTKRENYGKILESTIVTISTKL